MLSFPLGDEKLVFKKSTYSQAKPYTFLQLHDNEATAEEAAMLFLEQQGGVLLSVENGNNRYVTFALNGQTYTFDPNRMFTPEGLQATLQKLGNSSPEAVAAVENLASALLQHLPDTAVIIAVHNNTDSAFSALSYQADTTYQKDAAAVHLNSAHDADDFFLTTDKDIYNALVALNYNTILQDNDTASDDGSLSVYYGKKGIRYVNVEAEHGHGPFQLQMINDLLQLKKEQHH